MNIYIVRHSETDLNLSGVYYGSTDCDINSKGISQAKNLSRFFLKKDIDLIISSDLKRAYNTAKIIRGNRNIDIIKEKGLREIDFGDWENKTYNYIKENDKENYNKWCENWLDMTFPNGESYKGFYKRVGETFNNIIEKYENLENILIVGHNGSLVSLLCNALGFSEGDFWRFKIEQNTYTMVSIHNKYAVLEKYNCDI